MRLFPGVNLTFSIKRALGVTKLKQRVSRKIGLPLTRGGRQRKVGRSILSVLFGRKH